MGHEDCAGSKVGMQSYKISYRTSPQKTSDVQTYLSDNGNIVTYNGNIGSR